MSRQNRLSCAALLLSLAAPAFAQDAKPSQSSEDVIQDPMPGSRAQASVPAVSPILEDVIQDPMPRPVVATASVAPPVKAASAMGPLAASKTAPATTAYAINPAMLLMGGFGAEVDHAIDPGVSLFVAPSIVLGNSVFSTNSSASMFGFGVDVGLRFFSESHAPEGFWVGPRLGVAFVSATSGGSEASAAAIGLGGMLGYSWITDYGYYFSLGAGVDYRFVSVESSTISNNIGGIAPSLRIALGLAK